MELVFWKLKYFQWHRQDAFSSETLRPICAIYAMVIANRAETVIEFPLARPSMIDAMYAKAMALRVLIAAAFHLAHPHTIVATSVMAQMTALTVLIHHSALAHTIAVVCVAATLAMNVLIAQALHLVRRKLIVVESVVDTMNVRHVANETETSVVFALATVYHVSIVSAHCLVRLVTIAAMSVTEIAPHALIALAYPMDRVSTMYATCAMAMESRALVATVFHLVCSTIVATCAAVVTHASIVKVQSVDWRSTTSATCAMETVRLVSIASVCLEARVC